MGFLPAFYSDVLECRARHESFPLDVLFEDKKAEKGVQKDTDLTAEDLKAVVAGYKRAIRDSLGHDFPSDPIAQLKGAIEAVFSSWHNNRAR